MTTTVAPPTDTPQTVRAAALLWLVAVAAGIFETVLAVTGLLSSGTAGAGEVLSGVGLRVVVFGTAFFLVWRMWQGRNWARWSLVGLLGVLGLLSMVVEPVQWLLAGGSIIDAVTQAGVQELLFGGSRLLHVLAVLGAVALMFQPRARDHFRSA
ncbi:hypothetical protein [Nonomuraea glycinis]|uniref:hypothetical protein n=1 Tax=Nonomuraea glycinis TaxID=2047744 RepID=UPI002E152E6B|nr:hypothetical protein OHA68_08205 [Nonomuraea glycinis]